jgi:hypothetical protein
LAEVGSTLNMYKIIGADQREYGPVTADQIRQWVAEGRANSQTRARLEGTADWRALSELPEFFDALHPPPPGGYPPPAVASRPAPVGGYEYASAPERKTNGMAVAGFVCGILSLICCGPLFGVLGLTFSSLGLRQIKRDPGQFKGRGLAIAGLSLSSVGFVLSIIVLASLDWEDIARRMEQA